MNVADYWPMAREYLIWNARVAPLQFWTADLNAHVLSSTMEHMHLLCQQSEEVLFSYFMTTLYAAFESKLALADKGYDSGSENFNIPIPLKCTSRFHHVSSDDISFDPTLHSAWVPASHATNLYDTSYPSIALMKKMFLKLTLYCLPAQYHCRTPWIFHSSHLSSAS